MGGKTASTTMAGATNYELHLAQLLQDKLRLKQVQSNEGKAQLKAELLPTYVPYVEGVLAAGIDAPDHDGGEHFVLGAAAFREYTLEVGGVFGQQLALELGLALVGLDLPQAQAVLQELGELELVGVGAFHAVVAAGLGRLEGGGDALEVLAGRAAHGQAPTRMFSARLAAASSSIT